MRISRVNRWLNISCVIKQQIKNIVTFVLIGPDNPGIDGNVVGDQGVGDDPFLEAEVFG